MATDPSSECVGGDTDQSTSSRGLKVEDFLGPEIVVQLAIRRPCCCRRKDIDLPTCVGVRLF